ncbi:MAG: class I adenylate-forming enzyme family protein, partial [Eubacteriales bacterium]|nr:class I adenylate-forming enzyme family protein [Eubacteriales bacterium]
MKRVHTTIGAFLRERAEKSPDRAALSCGEQSYTWKELDDLSSFMAAEMAASGASAGTRAGIWSTNSPNWVITFLALEKLGAVPVLLNTGCTAGELERVLRYAGVELVYYGEGCKRILYKDIVSALQEKMKAQVKHWGYIGRDGNRRWLTKDSFAPASQSREALEKVEASLKQVSPEDTAAVLFTSGTTAEPKGVMLSHYSLINNAIETCEHMDWQEQDSMLTAVPLFHCFGISAGLLAGMYVGFSLHLLEYFKTVKVLSAVQEYRCTLLNGVPSMFLAMIRNPELG